MMTRLLDTLVVLLGVTTLVFFLTSLVPGPVRVVTQDGGGSPHGDDFDLDCAKCHSEEGWTPIRKKPDFKHR